MQNNTKKLIIIFLLLITFSICAICIRVGSEQQASKTCLSGGYLKQAAEITGTEIFDESLSRQTISIINKKRSNRNEIFFRPSRLSAINSNFLDFESFSQTFADGNIPASLMDTPVNTIINYFSVLQQASNLTEKKSGGSGDVGYSKVPYPIAYSFLSESNKKSMPYNEYLTSFEGIGHINLLNILPIITKTENEYKYFIELEILEGSSVGVTTFNYYTGELILTKTNELFYIDSLYLIPEDFFFAAYHGWIHNAEMYVEIVYGNWCGLVMKQYAPEQNDYKKKIIVDGVDKRKYMFEFAKLVNGTDLLINSLVKEDGNWIPVEIEVNRQNS
ncbi:hypothetical protein LY28_02208 [Ruminiclostridium sufflavum DSM 19573]|uniref:Uncharacterized protein n=1 Tax=Ruminiclostridium sufflavum DSM 19573 TaxID=1121337 RepID=A0A318XLE8_9FIRM|nr:hypothetical protein [Ruminiclostridium sufflavum]PYG87303.1 hypothetical protein LY28_02208 [Ruminiclostridium sufflavum DSM 19573]